MTILIPQHNCTRICTIVLV